MSKATFVKFLVRQSLRSLVFFLLIAVSVFMFVLRTTEFIAVRERIYGISEFYRSVGFLQVAGQPFGDVRVGADIAANSGFLAFEDRRRGVEAVMHDTQNAHIQGVDPGAVRNEILRTRDQQAFFIAVPTQIRQIGERAELRLNVDEVIVAHPEHVVVGDGLVMNLALDGAEFPFDGMTVGGRYLLSGLLYNLGVMPRVGNAGNRLNIYPLDGIGGGIWFLPANGDIPQQVSARIEQSKHNHSILQLRTSADMTAMPAVQESVGLINLVEGRFFNRQDYLDVNPVIVINEQFARFRGLNVGDSLVLSVLSEPRIADIHSIVVARSWGGIVEYVASFADFHILGNPGDFAVQQIALEIIGTYSFNLPNPLGHPEQSTIFNVYAYIPDSLLPPGLNAVHDRILDWFEHSRLIDDTVYTWDIWYSFVLNDPREQDAFLAQNQAALSALGLNALFIETDAENFWASAEPILQSITVNAVLSWVVLALVFSLVVFLFLHGRRKEFAISRALGASAKNTSFGIAVSLAILSLPAIFFGGTVGWLVLGGQIDRILGELEGFMGAAEAVSLPLSLPFLFFAVNIVIIMVMVLCGLVRYSRRPVIELLQDSTAKKERGV